MKIKIIGIGKNKWKFIDDGIGEFLKRIQRYCHCEYIYLPDAPNQSSLSAVQVKKAESKILLSKIESKDHIVLLDENGKSMDSVQFSQQIEKWQMQSVKQLVFIIGGAYGFSDEVYQRANQKISLSKMTFSHQLIRVIFAEQLYRAFTIIKGEKYHNL